MTTTRRHRLLSESESEAGLIRDRQLQAVIDRIQPREREGAMAEMLAQDD
jgi:hypothetical protein